VRPPFRWARTSLTLGLSRTTLYIMDTEKFSCPKCGAPVPKRMALLMTNFTKSRCMKCGTKICPGRKALPVIGGIGGAVGGGHGGLIGVYGINTGNWMMAGILFLLLMVLLVLVSSCFTVRFTKFIEVPKNV
jgi:hypothetical protein